MTSQAEVMAVVAPQKIENGWVVAMPKEMAEVFGLPEGTIAILYTNPGSVLAQINLAPQTDEARKREPGWLIKMPTEMAKAVGVEDGTIIGLYAKNGAPYVEIYPPLDSEFREIARQIIEEDREFFEEMKRLGD